MRRPLLLLFLAVFVVAPTPAVAQTGACVDLCRIPCVKPISIADRWDDVTGIPGYMGEPSGGGFRPDWRNNSQLNQEAFDDPNGNGQYDPSESFVDGNGNGLHDRELYDPATTGYVAPADVGLEIVLHPGDPFVPPYPGLYYSVMLPPLNKGTPDPTSGGYREAWSQCAPTAVEPGDSLRLNPGRLTGPTNQAMSELIALDPDAYWDAATQQVAGSAYGFSPRILFVPAHDPRRPLTSGGSNTLVVRKVLAFFAERMEGAAILRGRLLRVQAPGETCGGGSAGGFVVECPVPATSASWGRLKASYR